ncbi:MAG: hypothetical protein HRT71_12535 [Flavobacteriales bacterium]|nr:hypothetical protein [Flavobacteriales bacterium]
MLIQEKIEKNIDATLSVQKTIFNHFNNTPIDLGNKRYGVDIFSITVRGKGNNRYLHLSGIYKHGVVKLLKEYGIYSKRVHNKNLLIKKENNIINEVTIKDIKDIINGYLQQLPSLEINIDSVNESFNTAAQIEIFYRQSNMVLNESFLDFLQLEESEIIKDRKDVSALFFQNGMVEVDANRVTKTEYNQIRQGVVWKSNIVPFDIMSRDAGICHFSQFISNSCNKEVSRINALKSAMGYLLHSFHKKSGGQMVLLYDQSITDLNNPQGGTGKGIIANALLILRSTTKIDGKKFKGDNNFDFQEVTFETRLVWVDDVGKQMDIDRFNSISTDGFNMEQKNMTSTMIPPEESPKILLCANIILECAGTTRKRRQFIIELSSYYSSKITNGNEEPIVEEHGCTFFTDDWDKKEWNRFYWYMIDCLKLYLDKGLIYTPTINVVENRARQIIGDEFFTWIKSKAFKLDTDYSTKEEFEEFKELYENEKFSQRSFSNNLKKYYSLIDQTITFHNSSKEGKKVGYFRISN